MSLIATWLAVVSLATACHGGAKPRLVEVKDDVSTWVGKVVSKNDHHCCLMDQFGALANVPISRLESFRVVAENFRSASMDEFRQQLKAEFRSGYEIRNSAHYVVVGKKGRGQAYVSLFEEIYRQIDSFYSIRGFETAAPEFALVAIVFETQDEFKRYCEQDQVLWSGDLRGYYSLKTNRVVLYDDAGQLNNGTEVTSEVTTAEPGSVLANHSAAASSAGVSTTSSEMSLAVQLNSLSATTANTIIHETTHQVGYNIGIHSRVGETPMWVVEGLATVLEAPGLRSRSKSGGEKINSERLNWFFSEFESRRQPGDIAKMIASDELFGNQALDAYSEAWAFTYFLTETPARAQLFVRYLKLLSERDPMTKYTPENRLKDFQSVFGDISRLEVDFLRAVDRLETP